MSNKSPIDYSEISDGHMSRAWQAHAIRKSVEFDAYGAKTVFSVRVLTRPITLSGEEYTAIMGDAAAAGGRATYGNTPNPAARNFSRLMFKGRITGAGGVPSPHLTIPDPCYLHDTYSADITQCAARIISMHTTFFSNTNPQGATPEIGDVIRGQLEPGDSGKFNLQYATFTSMETVGNSARAIACRGALQTIFARAAGESSPAQMNANNPFGRALGDGPLDPVRDWSDRKLQRIMEWSSTKYTGIPNGTRIANGDMTLSPPGTYTDIGGGAQLISAAVEDWDKLKAAYSKKFPNKTLTAGAGYRSYQGQVAQRLTRHDTNDVYRGGCGSQASGETAAGNKCSAAAKPGTSNHGFGGAVDIDKGASGWDKSSYPKKSQSKKERQDTSGDQFKWLNKWAKNFNFRFGVAGENWHIDWIPLSDQLVAIQGSKPKKPVNPWANMLPQKPAITLV
jgi:hypothetical protein